MPVVALHVAVAVGVAVVPEKTVELRHYALPRHVDTKRAPVLLHSSLAHPDGEAVPAQELGELQFEE